MQDIVQLNPSDISNILLWLQRAQDVQLRAYLAKPLSATAHRNLCNLLLSFGRKSLPLTNTPFVEIEKFLCLIAAGSSFEHSLSTALGIKHSVVASYRRQRYKTGSYVGDSTATVFFQSPPQFIPLAKIFELLPTVNWPESLINWDAFTQCVEMLLGYYDCRKPDQHDTKIIARAINELDSKHTNWVIAKKYLTECILEISKEETTRRTLTHSIIALMESHLFYPSGYRALKSRRVIANTFLRAMTPNQMFDLCCRSSLRLRHHLQSANHLDAAAWNDASLEGYSPPPRYKVTHLCEAKKLRFAAKLLNNCLASYVDECINHSLKVYLIEDTETQSYSAVSFANKNGQYEKVEHRAYNNEKPTDSHTAAANHLATHLEKKWFPQQIHDSKSSDKLTAADRYVITTNKIQLLLPYLPPILGSHPTLDGIADLLGYEKCVVRPRPEIDVKGNHFQR